MSSMNLTEFSRGSITLKPNFPISRCPYKIFFWNLFVKSFEDTKLHDLIVPWNIWLSIINLIPIQLLLVSLTFRYNHMKFILSSSKFVKMTSRVSIFMCAHIQIFVDILSQWVALFHFDFLLSVDVIRITFIY